MGLSQLLAAALTSPTTNDNGPWRQFVLDHLDWITQRTTPSEIDRLLMNQYRYDLGRFLKERLNRLEDIAWIVLLLNDMSSDFEFVEPGTYIIPEDELIIRLYHTYITVENNGA